MTAPEPAADLDQLAATLAAATPGPWVVLNHRSVNYPGVKPWDCADVGSDHGGVVSSGWCAEEGDQPACEAPDAAAIVAAVNAAPVLIAELRALRATLAAVEALHQRAHPDGPTSCVECNKGRKFVPWPCDTARALGSGS